MFRTLAAQPGWNILEFDDLWPEASALAFDRHPGCSLAQWTSAACPVLTLVAGEPFAHVPSRQQRKLRMARNRAQRGAPVEFCRADAASSPSFLQWLIRLHGERWHSRGQTGVLSDERVRSFHQQSLPALVQSELARLYALRVGEEIAAVYYGFQHRTRAYCYLSGFDPKFSFISPGVLLLAHVMSESASTGVSEIHFLRGDERYKYLWGAVPRFNMHREFRRGGAADQGS